MLHGNTVPPGIDYNFFKNHITQKEIFEGYFPNDNNIKGLMRVLKIAPQTIDLIRKMIYTWKDKK